jgi:hypothetical protein
MENRSSGETIAVASSLYKYNQPTRNPVSRGFQAAGSQERFTTPARLAPWCGGHKAAASRGIEIGTAGAPQPR